MSGSTARIFVNGAQTATGANMGGALSSVVHYYSNFGTQSVTYAQAGLDEIKFYDRALTAAEILADSRLNRTIFTPL
jgi:hypothetical protein